MKFKFIGAGVCFALLWASASPAAKLAVNYVQPLFLFEIRFILAAALLLSYAHLYKKQSLPQGKEWGQLVLFGLLNTTLYLSLFVLAIKEISAGLGSLATSTNTLFISVLSSIFLGTRIKPTQALALFIGLMGVIIASYPLLLSGHANTKGLTLIFFSMLSYSVGTIYYSRINWTLDRFTINGWQVLFGALGLLPFTLYTFQYEHNTFHPTVLFSVMWLVIPVSIMAIQLWLYLLKENTVKASFFLFLCPIFGFLYAHLLLQEPITFYTLGGTILVIVALALGQRKN